MHNKTIGILGLVVVGMFGFGFAMVPLYNVICDAFGLNGKFTDIESGNYDQLAAQQKAAEFSQQIDKTRTVTVEFISSVNENLPWDFRPLQKVIKLHPGEIGEVKFYVKNRAKRAITGQAVPSLVPGLAVKYFTKMECFCFTQQTLKAGQETEMLLKFVVNPALPKRYSTLSLAYTFFDTNRENNQSGLANADVENFAKQDKLQTKIQ